MLIILDIPLATQLDLVYLILACVGIVIILVCIGTYFFSYGERLKDKIQEIKAFGTDMKISVVTVFIFVGVALIIPMVWTGFNNTIKALDNSRQSLLTEKEAIIKERDLFKLKFDEAMAKRTRDQIYLLDLEGISEREFPKKEDIQVVYIDENSTTAPQIIDHEITAGQHKKVKVTFKNINDETEYATIEVIYKSSNQRWLFEEFRPGRPSLTLKKAAP